MNVADIIKQSLDGIPCRPEQTLFLLSLPADAPETYQVMAEARRLSRELTGDRAEVHGQFALNLAPCRANCLFCSFAACNKIFTKASKISPEEAVLSSRHLEELGSSAIYMMATDNFPFAETIAMAREIKAALKPETMLIANVGDRTPAEARAMKEVGFSGVYHALRLGEGRQTGIDPQVRLASLRAFQEAGLTVGTCVEPIGPEHSNEELAERIHFTAELNPAFSGAARRISIPGTELAEKYGMISELRMAQVVAITRLALPRTVLGNCTHEPTLLAAAAGANLFWAEIGANPRDIKEKTEDGRGFTVPKCREMFLDVEFGVLEGPSRFFR
ncbi:radical SAM protein [Desulfurivibrio dismutans]|uniref:radical SAM protein n=1 Tax=Desulfurivibrio dismutans TaxID=1398908 RepID=UPI0023DC8D1B|nr:radical SAM protein [Desulfurivibrio alkaliphilus]MDF1615601.1 radical SAM protein [Desulfurivibrio alkaliphilus]